MCRTEAGPLSSVDTFTETEFWATLDAVGEDQVRINLIKKIYGDHGAKRELVLEWLRRKEESRALEASAKGDAREEETLSIAKDALAIAKDANRIASEDLSAARLNARWAMWAAIIATVAAAIAAKDQIYALIISWLH